MYAVCCLDAATLVFLVLPFNFWLAVYITNTLSYLHLVGSILEQAFVALRRQQFISRLSSP